MTRGLARYVRREMALLGLCELALSAVLIYGLLAISNSAPWALEAIVAPGWSGANLAAAMALSIVVTAATMGLYHPRICQDPQRLLIIATIAGMIASPVILWVGGMPASLPHGGQLVWLAKVLGVWLAVVLASRLLFNTVLQNSRLVRRVLVIGRDERATRVRDLLRRHHGKLFEPVMVEAERAVLAVEALRRDRIWGVVIAGDRLNAGAEKELLDGKLRGIKVFGDSGFHEQHLGRIDLNTIDSGWLLTSEGFAVGSSADIVKRVFDVVSSCALFVATLPLVVVTAVLIKLDSPGPIFYRQSRTGLFGVPFTLLKFRSMTADAEAGGQPRWAQKHDPRVTRVGRFIRQTRIDELPQLLNVLRGDMSMIGPRPERPHFVEELSLAIPFYDERAYVKPGITGWAQVNYPYGASVEDAREKLAYDLYYVKNRSILLDILIFCSTVRVVLFREGAR